LKSNISGGLGLLASALAFSDAPSESLVCGLSSGFTLTLLVSFSDGKSGCIR